MLRAFEGVNEHVQRFEVSIYNVVFVEAFHWKKSIQNNNISICTNLIISQIL